MNMREKPASEKAVYDVFGDSRSSANHNISSVLSQIQDDGPAYSDSPVYSESVEHGNPVDFRSNSGEKNFSDNKYNDRPPIKENSSIEVQSDDLIQDEVHLNFSETLKQKQRNKSAQVKSTTDKTRSIIKFSGKKAASLPRIFAVIVALIVVGYLYRLDVRTDKLEQSLILHEESVLESIDYQTGKISPVINNLKKTLSTVRDEIELMKANSASDNKLEYQTGEQSVQAYKNITALNDEVVTLRNELQTVIKKLNIINKNNQEKAPGAVNDKTDKNSATGDGWVVNIASFTDKNRSLTASTILTSHGYLSSVEEANVNGVKVYRIVVGGFKDRAEAEIFVRKAASEYGMKNGWIRKS